MENTVVNTNTPALTSFETGLKGKIAEKQTQDILSQFEDTLYQEEVNKKAKLLSEKFDLLNVSRSELSKINRSDNETFQEVDGAMRSVKTYSKERKDAIDKAKARVLKNETSINKALEGDWDALNKVK